MMIKCFYLATAHLILIQASNHLKDVDSVDVRDPDKDVPKTSCIDGNCALALEEKQEAVSVSKPVEEVNDKKEDNDDNLQKLSVSDLVQLLSLFASNANKGETKISFNVRDIQSGFRNSGSRYRVGNVHRELNRIKRDAESELSDSSTINNEGSETGVTVTPTNDAPTAVKVKDSKESDNTENFQASNGNTSVDVNVQNVEVNNFQDSNFTNTNDSVANDTTTVSVNENEESRGSGLNPVNDSNNVQFASTGSEVVSQVDKNSNGFLNNTSKLDDLGNENEEVKTGSVTEGNNYQTPSPKSKIPLSKKDLNNIQNVLSDDLGVGSKGAKPVANFSINVPLKQGKNPVVVLVYNCSCGRNDNHTHDNSTEPVTLDNDDTNDNKEEVVLNTRRMLTNDEPVASTQTEVKLEELEPEKPEKSNNEVNVKTSNALLENEWLRKCKSLLSLQRNNLLKAESENLNLGSPSLNQANIEASDQLLSGNAVNNSYNDNEASQNDSNNSNKLNTTDNVDSLKNDNSNVTVEAEQSTVDHVNSDSQLQNNDTKDVSLADVVAVSLVEDNVNAIASSQTSDLPTVNKVVEEQYFGNRKRRSISSDTADTLKIRNPYRNKRQITEILNFFFKSIIEDPSNNTDNDKVEKNREVKTENEESNDSKDSTVKTKREIKFRNPKYYDYRNDKPNLLESDPITDEHDGTVLDFKSIYDNTPIRDSNDDNSVSEQNKNVYNSIIDFVNKEIIQYRNTGDITNEARDLLNKLKTKSIFINVYLQILQDYKKDEKNDDKNLTE